MGNENTLIINIAGSAKEFIDELDKVKKKTKELEKVLKTTAKASALAFAGFAAAIALVTKSFAKYETALVGVGKTTNISGAKLRAFGKEFQKLSTEIPVATNELLGIAQAAGQLGVTGEKNLLKFTETIAKLGVATDLTGEQAATSLTRILNVTGEAIDTIDVFGSVIVELGNNFAATESEIVKVATEVSRSTAVFGVSAAQAAALGAALKSVGVQAQLGGSAIGRSFRAIDAAIRDGGASLDNLSKVTGIAGDQLKKTFEEDSAGVFQAFIEGLGKIQEAGGSTTQALEQFGLKGDEILKVLPVLAQNSELVGRAFNSAAKEVKNATALNKEAEAAFATLASTSQRTSNNFQNLTANIGEQLAPAITDLLNGVNKILKGLSELDDETLGTIASFLKWGAIITGLVAGISSFLLGILGLSAAVVALGAAFLPAAVTASAFWIAVTGPIGLAVLGIAAATAAVVGLFAVLDKKKPQSLSDINKDLELQRKLLEKNQRVEANANIGTAASDKIKERIKLLEEERDALAKRNNEADKSFGTGDALIRPIEADDSGFVVPDLTGAGGQTIPLRAEEAQDDSLEQAKKNQEKKTELVDAATRERIAAAQKENEALKAIQQGRADGLLAEDLAFETRKAAIGQEFADARGIKNKQERELAIQNLTLAHEEELLAIEEKENRLDELKQTRAEERAGLEEELRELSKEEQALFDEEDLEALRLRIDSQHEVEKELAGEKLSRQIEERNQFKKDEIQFGTEVAAFKKGLNSEEVQGVKSTTAALAQLQNSKNSKLKAIGKAAARINAAIATGEGAIKAYTSLAGIPIVGPALGALAAGALIAFGVEQQANISKAATGGFVPPAGGGARDRVPTMLEPNELVVPAAIAPNFIQAAGLPDTQSGAAAGDTEGAGGAVIEIMLQDRAGEFISLEQREGKALGLIAGE